MSNCYCEKKQVYFCGFIFLLKLMGQSKTFSDIVGSRQSQKPPVFFFIIHIDFENIIHIDFCIMKTKKYHIQSPTLVLIQVCQPCGDASWRHPNHSSYMRPLHRSVHRGSQYYVTITVYPSHHDITSSHKSSYRSSYKSSYIYIPIGHVIALLKSHHIMPHHHHITHSTNF